ncbi:MAG: hypothetical protein RR205_00770 [Oscillospiraceae bacterium]
MINIFNRKELFTTFSMEQQSQARNLLQNAGIEYIYKVTNRNNSYAVDRQRESLGRFGENQSIANQYTFYVHKDDLELAQSVLSNNAKM